MGFMEQMNVFSMHVMQALALSLGLGHDFFDSTFLHSPHYQMKVGIVKVLCLCHFDLNGSSSFYSKMLFKNVMVGKF